MVWCLIERSENFSSSELERQIQTVNIEPVLERLQVVDVGICADVSEISIPSILRVEL
jgi:uncharacterized protein YfkK (UPF0435 family)